MGNCARVRGIASTPRGRLMFGRTRTRFAAPWSSASCGKGTRFSALNDALLKRSIGWIPKWSPLLGPMSPASCGKGDPVFRTERCAA